MLNTAQLELLSTYVDRLLLVVTSGVFMISEKGTDNIRMVFNSLRTVYKISITKVVVLCFFAVSKFGQLCLVVFLFVV